MTNKKAQAGPIGVVFGWIIFFILYGMYLGKWLSDSCQEWIIAGQLTGLEAFIVANMPLFVPMVVLLAGAVYIYLSSG